MHWGQFNKERIHNFKLGIIKILNKFSYKFFSLLDTLIYVLIMALPGVFFLKLFKIRPWRFFIFKCSQKRKWFLKRKIIFFINKLSKSKRSFTTCLSRCFCGRLLFDFLGIENEIYISIIKTKENKKVPHASIYDPLSKSFITSFDNSNNAGYLTKF